jgi:hypothetical protein
VLQDFLSSGPRDSTDLVTTAEITAKIYLYLLKFADQRFHLKYLLNLEIPIKKSAKLSTILFLQIQINDVFNTLMLEKPPGTELKIK